MNQPTCCKKASWTSELDLGQAGGFEYLLGKCEGCGAYSMNVFCVASGINGFETVSPSDVERMKSIPAGPELMLIGDIGLFLAADGRDAEIGITLRRQSQGRGMGTAAAREAISLHRVEAGRRQRPRRTERRPWR